MIAWKRWLRYATAKVEDVVRSGEAKLRADRAQKPWLGDDSDTPSYEEVKARIEAETPARDVPKPSGNPSFDLAEQERAAAERLAEMRESLDLDKDER